jgi:hypothetical protein
MEPLDRKEPILCEHEINLVALEGAFFKELALQNLGIEDTTRKFRIPEIAVAIVTDLRNFQIV